MHGCDVCMGIAAFQHYKLQQQSQRWFKVLMRIAGGQHWARLKVTSTPLLPCMWHMAACEGVYI